MSAPDTNVNKQTRRHRGPLIGIAAAILFAAVLAFIFLADGGEEVTGAPVEAGGAVMENE